MLQVAISKMWKHLSTYCTTSVHLLCLQCSCLYAVRVFNSLQRLILTPIKSAENVVARVQVTYSARAPTTILHYARNIIQQKMIPMPFPWLLNAQSRAPQKGELTTWWAAQIADSSKSMLHVIWGCHPMTSTLILLKITIKVSTICHDL